MTIVILPQSRDYSHTSAHMASYQPQPPVTQGWDRWQHNHANPDYAMVDNLGPYDPRTVPSNTLLQRPVVTTQYQLPTTYAESPITPLSASPYGSQGHFNDYQAYTYETPNQFASLPLRSAHRPTAPPTPPMDDDRGLPLDHRRRASASRATLSGRRSPRRSVSVVKSESDREAREAKDCKKLIKEDGSLQYVSTKNFDVMLRGWDSLVAKKGSMASTPQSVASPGPEEEAPKKGKKTPVLKYSCKLCGHSCAQEAQLTTHMRSHTGEKPFKCRHCDFRCSQGGNLRSHERGHLKERPYECEICHQRFAANGGKKVHMATRHENKPKEHCPIPRCDKTFTTIGNMKNHIDKHHIKEVSFYRGLIEDCYFNDRPFPEEHTDTMTKLARIYKNSNRGIKGRGPDSQETKDKKERQKAVKREVNGQHHEMTPVSPDATTSVSEFRTYYDQHQQQHYQVAAPLPPPQQQHHHHQPQPGYLQLPMHPAQPQPGHQLYHALPTPAYSNMSWTSGSQYH